jgi:hypothetical protein
MRRVRELKNDFESPVNFYFCKQLHSIEQAGPELLGLCDPLALAFQLLRQWAGATRLGSSLSFLNIEELRKIKLCSDIIGICFYEVK